MAIHGQRDMGIGCAEIISVVLGRCCWQSFQAELFELVDVLSDSLRVEESSRSNSESYGVACTVSALAQLLSRLCERCKR